MSLLPPNVERKRIGILRLVVAGFTLLFVLHLLDLQVVNAAAINKVSLQKRQIPRTIEAVRGAIYDKDGKVLARSIYRYDVNVAPRNVGPISREVNGATLTLSVDQIADQLAAILEMDKEEILRRSAGTGLYANLKKKVDAAVYSQIKSLDIPWISFDPHLSRIYPAGAVAGNLLGFITSDGATKAGLESKMDPCLAGVDGKETYEQGVDGIRIPDSAIVAKEAKNGGSLKLTIDSNLEYFSQQVLETAVRNERADYGTAVVIEVKTGRLLVAAEAPTVDPNDPGAAIERDRQAKVFNFTYEPGSTMKTLTAATLLDLGLATPATRVVAPYRLKMDWGNAYIYDSHSHPTMKLTLAGVLRDSSNTGIVKLGSKASPSERFAYMKKFGLGTVSSLKMDGEATGLLGNPKTWDLQTDKNSMFGQGIATTPIQMAYAYQAIANGGVRLSPKLFEGCTAADGAVTNYPVGAPVRVVSEATARSTIDMLEKVVEEGGIGKTASVAGYRVGGKSGTAQIKQGNRYGNLYAISFIGMAPAEDPKYVVAVMLYKSRRTGSSIGATPVFKQIMQQVLRAYRVPPSTSKSKNIPTEWK